MRELEHEVDRDLMLLVEHALDRHAGRGDPGPLLAYEDGGRRWLLRLPATDDPSAAATEALLDTDERRRFRRAVVVWRTTIAVPGASPVVVRYARAQVAGEPQSCLFVQHYAAGGRPLGEPQLVDRGAALGRRSLTDREFADLVVSAGCGATIGLGVAPTLVWVTEVAAPTAADEATVTGFADGTLRAVTAAGDTLDLGRAADLLGPATAEGTRLQVVTSAVTGRITEVSSRFGRVDLADATYDNTVLAFVLVTAAVIGIGVLGRRTRPLWVGIAAAVALAANTAYLLLA
jgi:hypothetical protein